MGGVEDYFREQRRFREALGIGTTASAIAEAHKATQPLAELMRAHDGSLAKQIAEARDGTLATLRGYDNVASYLREHEAFSTSVAAGFVAKHRPAIEQAVTASAVARQYQDQIGGLNDRILREAIGVGRFASSAIAADALSAATIARHAELGALTRATHWATALQAREHAAIAGLLSSSTAADRELARLTGAAAGIIEARSLAASATAAIDMHGVREATAIKMSAFTSSLDLLGPRSVVGQAAFDALLGTWETRPDLPAAFWRDPPTRLRAYRDADVDPGLIDADNTQLVEVLVESGLVEGTATPTGVKAIVEIGPLRMSITARRARHDAFRAIDAFEVALRVFVATKLEAHLSQQGGNAAKWFTLRVPGNIVGEAKKTRQAAYQAGEQRQPLINFTNLGDLIGVITSNKNWDEVFGVVFQDRDGFKVDLQRLNAHRRPTMHARPIDGPRLAEIVLTIRRLMAMMQADGVWDNGWDDDE